MDSKEMALFPVPALRPDVLLTTRRPREGDRKSLPSAGNWVGVWNGVLGAMECLWDRARGCGCYPPPYCEVSWTWLGGVLRGPWQMQAWH